MLKHMIGKVFICVLAVFICAAPALAAPAGHKTEKLMVFGDSLVAGYGLPLRAAFPARLEEKLKEKNITRVTVVNAGVSGDTTASGLTRIDWALKQNPDRVIVVLGGNDMLRSLPPALTYDNLDKILAKLQARKLPVLLAGMRSFRNLGADFGKAYDDMYRDLAKKYDAVYYPFFLEGVAFDGTLNQDDGVHPNAQGVDVIVENILPSVEKLLAR